jgi:hypothetical protein
MKEFELQDFAPFDKWIPKDELVFGETYLCEARNFQYGMWDGEQFVYHRRKFGNVFIDHEYHYDDDAPNGTVKPLKKVDRYYYDIV